jgi:hypothetical protein
VARRGVPLPARLSRAIPARLSRAIPARAVPGPLAVGGRR